MLNGAVVPAALIYTWRKKAYETVMSQGYIELLIAIRNRLCAVFHTEGTVLFDLIIAGIGHQVAESMTTCRDSGDKTVGRIIGNSGQHLFNLYCVYRQA